MERNREARRGTVAAVNGGLSRRRQRNGVYRDSPEEDAGMEMQETGRLRDRGSKKDRDRDRSGRSKRKRGDRIMHASNREEGEDSWEESVDEEEDDEEEDASVSVRLPPAPAPAPNLVQASSLHQNHYRKSFPMTAKVSRPPVIWRVADEMIGVPVPRRARSAVKKSQEFSGGGVGGEPIHRQASTSPARPSPSSTTPISPSSSSASARKKMKPIGGTKHQQLKMFKSSSVSEDIEIEVAEVLYGLTRLPKQEFHKLDSKDTNGSTSYEARSRVSSPISISPAPPPSQPSLPPPTVSSSTAPLSATAPKRKRPRPVKFDDERPTSPASLLARPSTSVSSAAKMDLEQPAKTEASSQKSEKSKSSPDIENSNGQYELGVSQVATVPVDDHQDLEKPESNFAQDLKLLKGHSDGQDGRVSKEVLVLHTMESMDANFDETTAKKDVDAADSSREVKYSIDLMAPPPGKSSPDREGLSDYAADRKAPDPEIEMEPKEGSVKKEEVEKTTKQEEGEIKLEARIAENSMPEGCDFKDRIVKDRPLDLQFDLEKPNRDGRGCSKQQSQKQQSKAARIEPKPEKAVQSVSVPLPMPIAGWPAGFPPFGYTGQAPSLQAVVPMDGSSGSSKAIQPPNFLSSQLRPKRCATHCYIAHNIKYHQQIARMNPFWPAAAGASPLYGAKQYNLNVVPPLESSILGNPLQRSFPVRNLGSMQDKGGPLVAPYTGHSKEKSSAGNTFMEAAQRKQLVLQQAPQPGSATNMLAPAFIFPTNQQQTASPAARSVASKSSAPRAGNAVPSSSSASSAVAGSGSGGAATTMSFNYPGLPPNEAQYMAILQNSAYPFPIPAHVGGPPPYRGGSPGQAMPFFNGPFYSSHMLHPSQLQQQQPPAQQPSHTQQGHQNTSTSSGSSSSQKPPHQAPGGGGGGAVGSSQSFPASKQQRQHLSPQCETGFEDNPSNTDSRIVQPQTSNYGHNLAMAIHPQNFALLSPAAGVLGSGGGGSHNERQQQPAQHQPMRVELTTSQAFAMSFASFSGAAASAPPGLDFSSMAQNHALFQSLPEAARHGYQMAAAAAAAQATQQKKPQHHIAEDGKSAEGSMNASAPGEEERKIMATSKISGSVPQHSLTFSRPSNGPPISTVLGNSVIDSSSRTLNLIQAPASNSAIDSSSRTLNLIQAPANGGRVSNRPASAAPTTSGSSTATAHTPNSQFLQQHQHQHQQLIHLQKQHLPNSQLLHQQQQQQQQQQQLIHLQKQQQQQQLMNRTKSSAPNNSATIYSDRLPAGSTMSKFPQALSGFPQPLIQGAGATQSPQWKSSSTRGATPAPSAAPATSSVKNQHPQQQGRSLQQQPLQTTSHQTQISFGMNSSKAAAPTMQQHCNPSLSSATATIVGSPQSSSRSAGGSPRASPGAKPGPSQATGQQSGKSSPSRSTLKTSPMGNQNAPSILGHPHTTPAPNSGSKQQQHLQKQPFPQAQFIFSNAYLPAQSSQSNGSPAAGYYQRRQSEPPPQQGQPNLSHGPTGMLSLSSSAQTLAGASTTSDPAKAASAKGGIAAPGLLHHPAQFAAVAQSGFPYIHTMPSVSVKPAEQKPAAGN